MIRFTPDSWWDVVMRPLDMISPEANIYVEVSAPDLRLAAALLLGVAVLACWRWARTDRRPALWLLLLTLLAMAPWLATTGNGRYFTAFLLLLGPLCVGLVRLLPLSTSMKFATMGLLLLVQTALLIEDTPWGKWSLLYWREAPYFEIAAPPAQPRSYATITPISYSLIAPQFPEQSRWMNVSAPVTGARERERARKWLAEARSLHLVAPSIVTETGADGQPSRAVVQTLNRLMQPRGLSIVEGVHCEFLRSGGMAGVALRQGLNDPKALSRLGFWLCPLRYDPAANAKPPPPDPAFEAVFQAVEKLCPRFFRAGEAETARVLGGAARFYSSSDTRVYVMDDGEVMYKFWRSLNPVTIGTRAEVLAGRARVDCTRIRAPTWRSMGGT